MLPATSAADAVPSAIVVPWPVKRVRSIGVRRLPTVIGLLMLGESNPMTPVLVVVANLPIHSADNSARSCVPMYPPALSAFDELAEVALLPKMIAEWVAE